MKIQNCVRLLLLLLVMANTSYAQINPMGAQFYANQYLGNPALAAFDPGLNLSIGYRNQMASIPGSPVNQIITGEYRFGRVGVGINFNNEKTGLIRQTRAVGTYAYHLPLDMQNRQLHFGLSMGFLSERINEQEIVGNGGDPSVGSFNLRQTYIDGDFGMAYTTNHLSIQGALPNLKTFFKKDFRNTTNQSIYYSAISYNFTVGEGKNSAAFEPKLIYRGIQGLDNLWDIGTRIALLQNRLSTFGMYHNTQNFTFGIGVVTLNETLTFIGVYTTETSALRGSSNGNFEINVKYKVL